MSTHRGPCVLGETSPSFAFTKAATNFPWKQKVHSETFTWLQGRAHFSRQGLGVHVLLEAIGSISFVVSADESVSVVHAGAVNREPGDQTQWLALRVNQFQDLHPFISVVGKPEDRASHDFPVA